MDYYFADDRTEPCYVVNDIGANITYTSTERIIELHDLSYQELTALNLETLEHRRLSCDLT